MNVLMVGAGAAGSWQIRGVQLGQALGARVTTSPTEADWAWADVIVLVKRALAVWGAQARQTSCPVVWDAVDFWQQPAQNHLAREAAIAMAQQYMAPVSPDLVIGATQAMADDLGGVYVPHHVNPGHGRTEPRDSVMVVAYEGNPLYLGQWHGALVEACAKRGWTCAINPPRLADADIVVALRDGPWDGWMCQAWKSGVKLVNAIGVGRPVITQDSAAYREIHPIGATVDAVGDIDDAMDAAASPLVRVLAFGVDLGDYRLATIAERYRTALEAVTCPA